MAFLLGFPLLRLTGRVKLVEPITELLGNKLAIILIGERPGGDILSSQSISAYFAYHLNGDEQKQAVKFSNNPKIAFEYTIISNIYSSSLPPVEAGSVIVEKSIAILKHKAAGKRLENILKTR